MMDVSEDLYPSHDNRTVDTPLGGADIWPYQQFDRGLLTVLMAPRPSREVPSPQVPDIWAVLRILAQSPRPGFPPRAGIPEGSFGPCPQIAVGHGLNRWPGGSGTPWKGCARARRTSGWGVGSWRRGERVTGPGSRRRDDVR